MERFLQAILSILFIYVISARVNSQVSDLVFVTRSNANDFMHLENLIGSIHTYASKHSILVYDIGLTSIQRMILNNYVNVQIDSSIDQSRMTLIQHASSLYERFIYINVKIELKSYPLTIEHVLNRQGYIIVAESCHKNGSICNFDQETLASVEIVAYDRNRGHKISFFTNKSTQLNDQQSSSNEIHSAEFEIRHQKSDLILLPFIDLIRKRFRLAIVIPFINKQLDELFQQLNSSEYYSPCHEKSSQISDILFYYNRQLDRSLEERIEKYLRSSKSIHRCFKRIRFLSANLTNEEDTYPRGINLMWQRLFVESAEHDTGLSMRRFGYTHFFWMEPDTLPIRNNWLDALIDEITSRSNQTSVVNNWWIRGSMYRGTFDIEDYLIHINGNALYHLSSIFLEYLKLVWTLFPFDHQENIAFDTNTFFYMIGTSDELPRRLPWKGSKVERQNMAKQFWHKLTFSEFIQNCAYTGCMNDPVDDSPLTYFIHGDAKKISRDAHKNLPSSLSSLSIYWKSELFFIVFGIFFLFIIVAWIRPKTRRHMARILRLILKIKHQLIPIHRFTYERVLHFHNRSFHNDF